MACRDTLPRCAAPALPVPEGQHLPRLLFPLPSGMKTPKRRTKRRQRALPRPLSRRTPHLTEPPPQPARRRHLGSAPARPEGEARPRPAPPSPPGLLSPHLLPRRGGSDLGAALGRAEAILELPRRRRSRTSPSSAPQPGPASPERCLKAAPTEQRLPLSRFPPTAAAGPLRPPRPFL